MDEGEILNAKYEDGRRESERVRRYYAQMKTKA